MANAKKKKPRRKAVMLGVGLDSDGHKRLTTGPNFILAGGTQETHEVMTEKAIKINEKLAAKGKQLEEVSHEEFDEMAQSVGLHRQGPSSCRLAALGTLTRETGSDDRGSWKKQRVWTMRAAEYSPYLFISVLLVASVVFALTPLGLAWLWAKKFSPRKPGPGKNAIYECGLESKGDAWVQFKAEYYLYAIIFLIFDVETIFVLPFAVAFGGLTAGAFIAMIVFLLLLAEGLAWAWQKGVLTWR